MELGQEGKRWKYNREEERTTSKGKENLAEWDQRRLVEMNEGT
jgi:hypothetical protein